VTGFYTRQRHKHRVDNRHEWLGQSRNWPLPCPGLTRICTGIVCYCQLALLTSSQLIGLPHHAALSCVTSTWRMCLPIYSSDTMNMTESLFFLFSERELTFTFAIILSSSVRMSSVCLSVVWNVRAPYTQAIEIFGNVSTPFGTLTICWLPGTILRRSSQGNPSVGGVKH